MGARTARIGLIGYAATIMAFVSVGFWHNHLLARLDHDYTSDLGWQLKVVGAVFLALEVLALVALLLVTRVPPATRARRLLFVAAILAGVALVVGEVERAFLDERLVSFDHLAVAMRVVATAVGAMYAASEILLGVAALRIAGAAQAGRVRGLAIAAIGARGLIFLFDLVPVHHAGLIWIHRAGNLVLVALCASLAVVVTRIAEPDATPGAGGDGRLAPAWRAPADGISLYIGAGVARVVCAFLSWLAMLQANHAHGLDTLREVRAEVLMIAVPSAIAAILMMVALWRVSAAPLE